MIPKSEIRTKNWLNKNGFDYIRAGRSFGIWDFVAYNQKCLWFIQAKCNQAPRKEEMNRLTAFINYPKYGEKKIFVWKRYKREPIIKEVGDRL